MKKLYEKNEVWFALCWIIIYVIGAGTMRANFGDESPMMLLVLAVIGSGIFLFVRRNRLEEKNGLNGWPANWAQWLYFIPMWIIATGNLWGGISPNYSGVSLICAVLSMTLIGFVEEVIFRGFLFKALLSEGNERRAVIIAALTFGIGHFVNLFTGQAGLHTVIQIIFAVAWGFVFTLAFYRSGSLWPSILAHSMVDVFSCFAVDNPVMDSVYVAVTIVVSAGYCYYLLRHKPADR